MQPRQSIPETPLVLLETLNATFDANGVAQASITVGAHDRWEIRLFNTRTTSSTQTRVTVYRGLFATQLDFSRTGNADTSNTDIKLQQGETLSVEWTGGSVGAVASLDIEGTRYQKGRRGYGV